MTERPKFIADENVGKLGRYLRRLGFDTAIFEGGDDRDMVKRALAEGRTVLTRDTHIGSFGVAARGRVKVVTFATDSPEEQLKQVINDLGLSDSLRPLTLCLECNCPLMEIPRQNAAQRVPPYVFETQERYTGCPCCKRLYWRGSHWQAMQQQLKALCD